MSVIEMPVQVDLSGRMIMLNLEKCQRFQCPGFALSPNTPSQMVPPKASMNEGTHDIMVRSIQAGIYDGRLVDVTEQAAAGLKIGESRHTAVAEEDTDLPKVLMATDKTGRLYVLTPKDKEHEAALIKELKDTGTLASINFSDPESTDDRATGFTPITIEPLTPKIIITDL